MAEPIDIPNILSRFHRCFESGEFGKRLLIVATIFFWALLIYLTWSCRTSTAHVDRIQSGCGGKTTRTSHAIDPVYGFIGTYASVNSSTGQVAFRAGGLFSNLLWSLVLTIGLMTTLRAWRALPWDADPSHLQAETS